MNRPTISLRVLAACAVVWLAAMGARPASAQSPFLGMQVQGTSAEAAAALGLDGPTGVLVRDVVLGAAADKAGIERGDLIVEFAGRPVESFETLVKAAGTLKPGIEVRVVVMRQGRRVEAGLKPDVRPEAWGAIPAGFAAVPNLGLTMAALTPQVREQFGVRWESRGVLVTLIDETVTRALSPPVDLARGEVIVQANQKPVWRPDQVMKEIAAARSAGRKFVLLLVEGSEPGRRGYRFSLLPVK